MHRGKSLFLIFLLGTAAVNADDGQNSNDSFQEFRKNLLSSYSSFREGVLKDYAKFLETTWEGYETFKGEKRDSTPKPATAPTAPAPEKPAADGVGDGVLEPPAPLPPVIQATERPSAPVVSTKVKVPENIANPYRFDFYGIPMKVADINVKISNRLEEPSDYARQWVSLSGSASGDALVKALSALAEKLNFNDYLTFDLVRHYVDSRYAACHSTSRAALTHYLLANMGYDVRIAYSDSGQGLLLVPFDTKVYGIPFMTIDNVRYCLFADEALASGTRIYTCTLPENAPKGKTFGLRLNPISIPVDERPFDFSYGALHLTGTVNANLFPIIYRYPQMEIGDYAQSVLDPDLRSSIVDQVKVQLGEKNTVEAINNLLQFTQSAFSYATDQQSHGFEKPYFFEEILFYPQCDCEDRAIFYSYLLWNALGVENQLINYPGHESAAVALPEKIGGDNYRYGDTTFYISDPTYIGSVTGQCMPTYRINKPELDYHYK